MVNELECMSGGCSIGNMKFNVICYADDLLLLSSIQPLDRV